KRELDSRIPIVPSPDHIHLFVIGGAAGGFSAFIPGWGPKSSPVFRSIEDGASNCAPVCVGGTCYLCIGERPERSVRTRLRSSRASRCRTNCAGAARRVTRRAAPRDPRQYEMECQQAPAQDHRATWGTASLRSRQLLQEGKLLEGCRSGAPRADLRRERYRPDRDRRLRVLHVVLYA